MNKIKNNADISCPVEYALTVISGKWKVRILYALVQKSPQRFKVLEREIASITPTMLTSQLRELEKDGLIHRQIFATVPPMVEYSITEIGISIRPMILEMKKWGISHKSLLVQNSGSVT